MSVDPLAAAEQHVAQQAARANASILENEPLRTWVLGFAEMKATSGSLLTWDEIEVRLAAAAREAAKPKAKVNVAKSGGRATRARVVTSDERSILERYAAQPLGKKPIQTYLKNHHPELYLRLKGAANGRGQGTRPDEGN